jgi:hypothetical protein
MAGNGFPGAIWIPAHPDRYTVKPSRTIDAIVLHATDGIAVDAPVTARNVFASPKEWDATQGTWHQQSAHYIVGRDGTVVQCVLHKDIAWHANAESLTTIGIEHNARETRDTTLTGIQYWKSAAGRMARTTAGHSDGPMVHLGPFRDRSRLLTLALPPTGTRLGHLHARHSRGPGGSGRPAAVAADATLDRR